MKFSKRLRLFAIGMGLGCLVVWGMVMQRDTFPAWTPEGRILETLQKNPVKITPIAACMMECNNISNYDMLSLINSADVIFSESTVRGIETPEYVLEGKGLDGRKYKMRFRSKMNDNELLAVIPFGDALKTCSCQ